MDIVKPYLLVLRPVLAQQDRGGEKSLRLRLSAGRIGILRLACCTRRYHSTRL